MINLFLTILLGLFFIACQKKTISTNNTISSNLPEQYIIIDNGVVVDTVSVKVSTNLTSDSMSTVTVYVPDSALTTDKKNGLFYKINYHNPVYLIINLPLDSISITKLKGTYEVFPPYSTNKIAALIFEYSYGTNMLDKQVYFSDTNSNSYHRITKVTHSNSGKDEGAIKSTRYYIEGEFKVFTRQVKTVGNQEYIIDSDKVFTGKYRFLWASSI